MAEVQEDKPRHARSFLDLLETYLLISIGQSKLQGWEQGQRARHCTQPSPRTKHVTEPHPTLIKPGSILFWWRWWWESATCLNNDISQVIIQFQKYWKNNIQFCPIKFSILHCQVQLVFPEIILNLSRKDTSILPYCENKEIKSQNFSCLIAFSVWMDNGSSTLLDLLTRDTQKNMVIVILYMINICMPWLIWILHEKIPRSKWD